VLCSGGGFHRSYIFADDGFGHNARVAESVLLMDVEGNYLGG
jgi:hypothetical protein